MRTYRSHIVIVMRTHMGHGMRQDVLLAVGTGTGHNPWPRRKAMLAQPPKNRLVQSCHTFPVTRVRHHRRTSLASMSLRLAQLRQGSKSNRASRGGPCTSGGWLLTHQVARVSEV